MFKIDFAALLKTPFYIFVIYSLAIGGIILPGILYLFVFYRDIFVHTELIKLLLLAMSISAPVFALNVYLAWFIERLRYKGEFDTIFAASLANGGLIAVLSFFISILMGFLFLNSGRWTICWLTGINAVVYLIYVMGWFLKIPR